LEGEGCALWISFQILREYPAAVTRPQATSPALPMASAIADVRRFQQVFYVAEDRQVVLDRLLALLGAYFSAGRQVHDTNIVATMLEHGIRRLLTFNAADFRRFARIIELEPTQ
jgi:predicted nucleic acid-binding protein